MKVTTFRHDQPEALTHFVNEGFAIYRNIFAKTLIADIRSIIQDKLQLLQRAARRGDIDVDTNGWAVAIMEHLERTDRYGDLLRDPALHSMAKQYVGPDVAWLGHDALWINMPKDKDPVLLKGQHVDAWTGTGVNTIFAKIFFTDVDKYNGIAVCPGSHLQGMIPVRNRSIDAAANIEFKSINLDMCKAGDVVIWHSLLVHSTVGHSDKNTRISMTARFTSTSSEFTTQEKALGYRPLTVGPLNQVLRLIGNDYLTPLRTYGGFVGVDRRMAGLYNHSRYKKAVDYRKWIGTAP